MNKVIFEELKKAHEEYIESPALKEQTLITLELEDEELYSLMLNAEQEGVFFNDYLTNILEEKIQDVL